MTLQWSAAYRQSGPTLSCCGQPISLRLWTSTSTACACGRTTTVPPQLNCPFPMHADHKRSAGCKDWHMHQRRTRKRTQTHTGSKTYSWTNHWSLRSIWSFSLPHFTSALQPVMLSVPHRLLTAGRLWCDHLSQNQVFVFTAPLGADSSCSTSAVDV